MPQRTGPESARRRKGREPPPPSGASGLVKSHQSSRAAGDGSARKTAPRTASLRPAFPLDRAPGRRAEPDRLDLSWADPAYIPPERAAIDFLPGGIPPHRPGRPNPGPGNATADWRRFFALSASPPVAGRLFRAKRGLPPSTDFPPKFLPDGLERTAWDKKGSAARRTEGPGHFQQTTKPLDG